jgi:hypothetical protein
MKLIAFLLLMLVCNSCFLLSDFKKTRFSFSHNDKGSVKLPVPKKFSKSELKTDSSGNQVQYYFYSDGPVLYFAFLKDTSTQLQPINYDLNVPREVYQTIYFKGLDSSYRYWRETRFGNYKAGYKNVIEGDDGKFDSSINYFSLKMNH